MNGLLDIHSHILFNMDDGAQDIEESVKMLRAAQNVHVAGIVATPHVRNAQFNLSKARENFLRLKERALGTGIELTLGFEVHCNTLPDIGFDHAALYCTEHTNDLLLEFDLDSLPIKDERLIYKLQREGLNVIIAHPERYTAVQTDLSRVQRWIDMGCELQLDAHSMLQNKFGGRRKCAEKLIKRNMVHYIASDAHCAMDYEKFGHAVRKLHGKAEFIRR